MPLYEFSCRKCGAVFEELSGLHAETTPVCPCCASPDTARLLSAALIRGGQSVGGSAPVPLPGMTGLSSGCRGSGGFS